MSRDVFLDARASRRSGLPAAFPLTKDRGSSSPTRRDLARYGRWALWLELDARANGVRLALSSSYGRLANSRLAGPRRSPPLLPGTAGRLSPQRKKRLYRNYCGQRRAVGRFSSLGLSLTDTLAAQAASRPVSGRPRAGQRMCGTESGGHCTTCASTFLALQSLAWELTSSPGSQRDRLARCRRYRGGCGFLDPCRPRNVSYQSFSRYSEGQRHARSSSHKETQKRTNQLAAVRKHMIYSFLGSSTLAYCLLGSSPTLPCIFVSSP